MPKSKYNLETAKMWGGTMPVATVNAPGVGGNIFPPANINPAQPSLLTGAGSLENFGFEGFKPNTPAGGWSVWGGGANTSAAPTAPPVEGAWTKPAGFALGVAQVGLGTYTAMEQAKMNKFMRGYYGNEMARMGADFSNNAKSANENLAGRQERLLSARGIVAGSEESKAGVADYMKQWGAKETF